MKNRVLLTLVVLVGMSSLLTTVASPATAASPRPAGTIECLQANGVLTVQHRAPVHTEPSGSSHVSWFAAKGKAYRVGGYCDNSYGNRWWCIAGCDFENSFKGFWIFDKYFRP